ncbi:hypothetical protein ONZ45_g8121 [Pleurotus djamor]|nr:hypothetical protein ONZ45_g8121 [Pleurotus djamor]
MSQQSRNFHSAPRFGNFFFDLETRQWTPVSPNKTHAPNVSVLRDTQGPHGAVPQSASGFTGSPGLAPTGSNSEKIDSSHNLGLPLSQRSVYSTPASKSQSQSAHQYSQLQGLFPDGVRSRQPLPALPHVDDFDPVSPLPHGRPRGSFPVPGERELALLPVVPSDRFSHCTQTSILVKLVPSTSRDPTFAQHPQQPLPVARPSGSNREWNGVYTLQFCQTEASVPAFPSSAPLHPQAETGYEFRLVDHQDPPTRQGPKRRHSVSKGFEDMVPSHPSLVDQDTIIAIKGQYPSLTSARPQTIQELWNIAGLLRQPFSNVVPQKDCQGKQEIKCLWDPSNPCGKTFKHTRDAVKRHLLEYHKVPTDEPIGGQTRLLCLWGTCTQELLACNLVKHIVRSGAHGINPSFLCPFPNCKNSCTEMTSMIRHFEKTCVGTKAIHRHAGLQAYCQKQKDRHTLPAGLDEDEDEDEPARKKARQGD